MNAERVTIRSYRRIFRVERRLYKVDRWVLPVPGGVPLRGLAYFLAALAIVVALGRLPVVGALLGLLTPPLRYVILPLGAAMLATHIAPDGRAPHRFAWSWLSHRLTARRRSTGRAVPMEGERSAGGAQLHLRADHRTAELRRARVYGPGAIEFSAPVAVGGRTRALPRPPNRRRAVGGDGHRRARVAGGRAPRGASAVSFPLRYAHQNLLFGHGEERAALYRVELDSYAFLPARGKLAALGRLARLAYSVGADFSLWWVNRAHPPEQYLASAEELLDPYHQERVHWVRHLEAHAAWLRELAPQLPELYLAVSLAPPEAGLGASLAHGIDRARRRVERAFGVATPEPVSASELEALAVAEERLFERLGHIIALERASTRELQWLIRRAACRGVSEPALDPHWRPNALMLSSGGEEGEGGPELRYQPLETDLLRHASAPLLEEERTLVIDAEEGRSHQAVLALGALPEEADFPGGQSELLFAPLEALDFAVDACLHARLVTNRDAMARVRRRIVDADNVHRDQSPGGHGASFEADENRLVARELEAYLKSDGHPPLLRASISLAVGAPSREELERRVESLRAAYGTIALHRPLGLQSALFHDHLPRIGPRVMDYLDYLTIEQFGALMATGTHRVGSERGAYIGTTGSGGRRPVFFDPTEAAREGRPSAILMAGTLGSGKTIAAQLIAYSAERRGSRVVSVDPKGSAEQPDHRLAELDELEGRTAVIELSGDADLRGMLDPLRVAAPSLREDLASSYLIELLPQVPPAWETHIRRAVREAVEHERHSLQSVLEALVQSKQDDARAAADALSVWSDAGLAGLAFSGKRADDEVEADAAVTTIRTSGLTLPTIGIPRADYSQSERISVATLKLVAAFAMRLAAGAERHAVVLQDEASALIGTPAGRASWSTASRASGARRTRR